MRIEWNEGSLLDERDRFTRQTIEREFEAHPTQGFQPVEGKGALFATPVINNRYTVLWERIREDVAEVKAVLASEMRAGENPSELRRKLERVFKSQSYGQTLHLD
jgi:hypothetical protein